MEKTILDRFAALHGREHGTFSWIARALGRSQEHVSRALRGERPAPPEWTAIAEMLERMPKEQWPERWKR